MQAPGQCARNSTISGLTLHSVDRGSSLRLCHADWPWRDEYLSSHSQTRELLSSFLERNKGYDFPQWQFFIVTSCPGLEADVVGVTASHSVEGQAISSARTNRQLIQLPAEALVAGQMSARVDVIAPSFMIWSGYHIISPPNILRHLNFLTVSCFRKGWMVGLLLV